jgi:hypothetical protein
MWLRSHQPAMDNLVGQTNSGSNSMEKIKKKKKRFKRLLTKQNDFHTCSVIFFYSMLPLFPTTLINFFTFISP